MTSPAPTRLWALASLVRRVLVVVVTVGWLAMPAGSANAASYTWLGTTNGSWGTSTNWGPNGVPGTTFDDVTYNNNVNTSILIGGVRKFNSLVFDTGAGPFTFEFGTDTRLDYGSSNPDNSVVVNSGVTNNITFAGGAGWWGFGASSGSEVGTSTFTNNSASATLNINTQIYSFGGTRNLVFAGAGNTTVAGRIYKASSPSQMTLTKNDGGTLTLASGASFLGWQATDSITINGGMLKAQVAELGNGLSPISIGTSGTLFFDNLADNSTITSGPITNNGNVTVNKTGNSLSLNSFNRAMSGTGSFTKTGGGTLTLSGSNSYSGNTTISAGRLALTGSGVLGSGSYAGAIANSGELSIGSDVAQVLSGMISGTGTLTKSGSGTLTLSGSNSYSGNTTISAGRLALMGNGVLGSGSYAGAIANSGELSIGNDVSQSLSGVISGIGALTKSGAGTLTLLGVNNFNGTVTINGGAVSVASWNNSSTAGVWGGSASLIQMNGGRINYTGPSTSGNLRGINLASGTNTIDIATGATLNFAATNVFRSNGGDLIKEGEGTLQIGTDMVANNIFSGRSTINAGTLDWFGGGSMPSPASLVSDFLTINPGGTFAMTYNVGSTVNANIGFRLSGNATIVSGGAVGSGHGISGPIADGATAGSLVKSGAGVLTLSGSNSFTGNTRVRAGTLNVNNVSALAASTLDMNAADAGAVTFAMNTTIGGLMGSRNLDMGSRTLSVGGNNQSTNYSGRLSNGSLTKVGVGALTLSGSGDYIGPTLVSAGSLLVNGTLGSTAVTVQPGGLLGGSGRIGGSVSVLAGGTYSPGNSPGLLASGPLSLAGTTLMEIDGSAPRGGIAGYDATDVTGLLTYGGSMLVDFGFDITSAFANNTTFNLFDFTSRTGSFTGITTANDGSFYSGLTFANSGDNDKWTATKGTQTLEFTHSTGVLAIVPEPHAALLAGCGIAAAALAFSRRRRRGQVK